MAKDIITNDTNGGAQMDTNRVGNVLVFNWRQWAAERFLRPASEMMDKYARICVLCKEERRCGECCVTCPRMVRHMGCDQEIKCEYVRDLVNSMQMLVNVDEWNELYKNTVSDTQIQERCRMFAAQIPVSAQNLKGFDVLFNGRKVAHYDSSDIPQKDWIPGQVRNDCEDSPGTSGQTGTSATSVRDRQGVKHENN